VVQKILSFRKVSPEMQKLGDYLRRLRKEIGLSIYEVAKRTETTPSYISKLETGKILQSINVKNMALLAKAYEMPITVILEECGFAEKSLDDLPGLGFYLKMKYKFPPQAIRDMETAKEIFERKYKIS